MEELINRLVLHGSDYLGISPEQALFALSVFNATWTTIAFFLTVRGLLKYRPSKVAEALLKSLNGKVSLVEGGGKDTAGVAYLIQCGDNEFLLTPGRWWGQKLVSARSGDVDCTPYLGRRDKRKIGKKGGVALKAILREQARVTEEERLGNEDLVAEEVRRAASAKKGDAKAKVKVA